MINSDMAPLCGMANGSVYYKWVNKQTEGGKLKYLLDFLKNTNQSFDDLFVKEASREYKKAEEKPDVVNTKVELYSCPDCIERKKTIDELTVEVSRLNEKILDKQETIEALKGHIKTLECKKETDSENSSQYGQGAKHGKAG